MKTISSMAGLSEYGIDPLTGEACSLMYRVLCDLTAAGKQIVERALGVEIKSENWNSGADNDPHLASVMVAPEMVMPLPVFALLESGCTEVWLGDSSVLGVERDDNQAQVEFMKNHLKVRRRFAYAGPHQDRNQHQMSDRVR